MECIEFFRPLKMGCARIWKFQRPAISRRRQACPKQKIKNEWNKRGIKREVGGGGSCRCRARAVGISRSGRRKVQAQDLPQCTDCMGRSLLILLFILSPRTGGRLRFVCSRVSLTPSFFFCFSKHRGGAVLSVGRDQALRTDPGSVHGIPSPGNSYYQNFFLPRDSSLLPSSFFTPHGKGLYSDLFVKGHFFLVKMK